jgi:hypothetical protein
MDDMEHLFSSQDRADWRGRPLTSHEVVIDLISATTTKQGLRVHAERDPGSYPAAVSVSDSQLKAIPLTPHSFHGEWNYTIAPGIHLPRPDS